MQCREGEEWRRISICMQPVCTHVYNSPASIAKGEIKGFRFSGLARLGEEAGTVSMIN
jgi:hypothetical protein